MRCALVFRCSVLIGDADTGFAVPAKRPISVAPAAICTSCLLLLLKDGLAGGDAGRGETGRETWRDTEETRGDADGEAWLALPPKILPKNPLPPVLRGDPAGDDGLLSYVCGTGACGSGVAAAALPCSRMLLRVSAASGPEPAHFFTSLLIRSASLLAIDGFTPLPVNIPEILLQLYRNFSSRSAPEYLWSHTCL